LTTAWIEYHDGLLHHHKVRKLAKHLGLVYPHALGHLSCLWLWAVTNARSGDLTKFEDDELSEGAKWTGDPGVFVGGLTTAELLDANRHLHDWNDHGTRMLDQSRERMRVLRFKHGNRDVTVTTASEGKRDREKEGEREGKKESKGVRAALVHFGLRFKAVVGDAYPVSWQKDYTLMAQVVKQYGDAKALDLIDLFFEKAGEDGSWHRDKLCVGVFRHQLYKLVMVLAEERAVPE